MNRACASVLVCGVLSWGALGCSSLSSDDESASPAFGTGAPGAGGGSAEMGGGSVIIGASSGGSGSGDFDGASTGTGGGAPMTPGMGSGGSSNPSNPPPTPSGVLTAGTWDDNQNFDFFMAYRTALALGQRPGLLPIGDDLHRAARELFAQPSPRQTLDIALVIDTTGSMGDEISYLQAEFQALSTRIGVDHPNAEQRWSLVVYRDIGDAYVVKSFDFSADLAEFQGFLGAESAGGGGDFPEAPDAALARTAELGWRAEATTAKLSFWVADAPHHTEDAPAMAAAIQDLQATGVHVYPVASSGVDEITELTMRSAAQLTGGRYLFLTNDSGIGGDHKEPTIPCYYVTALDDAILRMVDIELSGVYREPAETEIVRTSGSPTNGTCDLSDGQSVGAY